jgi:hypothetical protein
MLFFLESNEIKFGGTLNFMLNFNRSKKMTVSDTLSGKYPVIARLFELINHISEDRLLIILKEMIKAFSETPEAVYKIAS